MLETVASEQKTETKAIVASNIMYITSKYIRIIQIHSAFLFVILDKVLEFMVSSYPGMSSMAVNTFVKLCEKSQNILSTTPSMEQINNENKILKKLKFDENFAFSEDNPGLRQQVWDLIQSVESKMKKLNLQQKITFYEGLGHILGGIENPQIFKRSVDETLTPFMSKWKTLLSTQGTQENLMRSDDTTLSISFFLNVNEKLSFGIKTRFSPIFGNELF